jgi:hypothetical protein
VAISDLIDAAEVQYGIPKGLYSRLITRGERSGPYAVSPAGAIGTAQLIPSTAKGLGVDPWNPEQNIQGGAKYLAQLIKRYGGDIPKAVAAYNEGPHNLDRGRMPAETQAYLGRVLGMDGGAGGIPGMGDILSRYGATPQENAFVKQQGIKSYQEARQASEEEARAAKVASEGIGREIKASEAEAPLGAPPTAPTLGKEPHTEEQDPTRVFKQFLPLLTIFGGALNRRSGTAALAATVGALNAAKTNDQDAMKRAHEQWLSDTKTALDNYQAQRDAWDDIVKKKGISDSDRMARMEAYAAQYQIPHMHAALANGNLGQVQALQNAVSGSLDRVLPLFKFAEDQWRTQNAKWQIYTDPATNQTVRVNPETGQSTDMQGNPITVSGSLNKVGGMPRGGPAAVLQKFQQEHPDATAEDMIGELTKIKQSAATETAFSAGKQGSAVRSFNVALSHLDTLDRLSKALKNGDIRAINEAKQRAVTEFGDPNATSFDAAKKIVSDEVVKAIIGNGGAVSDRQSAEAIFNRASSPAQFLGSVGTLKKLMGGQLEGLKKQYESGGGTESFDSKLSPEAVETLRGLSPATSVKKQSAPAPATRVIGGKTYYNVNGEWYDNAQGH